MSPILCLIASCLLQSSEPAAEHTVLPPEADPVIGWARVEFNADGVTRAEAGGLADLETGRELTVDDPVRIASVSKLVVALGVMRLVEAGILDLDADVSGYLGWSLRNPGYPEVPITLSDLLSHRSGLRDSAGYALPLGEDLETHLSNMAAWDMDHASGHRFEYANLNYPVIAAVMEAATGTRFDVVMAQQVFEPLDIDACFNWTMCSDEVRNRAVTLYRPSGEVARDSQSQIREDCFAVPASDGSCDIDSYILGRHGAAFSPQGGLRISARDLVTVVRNLTITGGELFDEDSPFLSRIQRIYISRAISGISYTGDGDFFCQYFDGIQLLDRGYSHCENDLFPNRNGMVGHAGEAYSLRSGVWIDPVSGNGVAYFATGLPETGALPGRSRFSAIEERLAHGMEIETFVPLLDANE